MFFKELFSQQKSTKQATEKHRLCYLDTAKGICIVLMITVHCNIPIGGWLSHIMMPLFFVLSGLFFKDYGSFGEFLRRKTNSLLIPFISFYCIGLFYAFAIDFLCHVNLDKYNFGIPGFVYGRPMDNYALWFLLSLFWTNLIFWCISHTVRNEYIRAGLVFVLAFLSYFMNVETARSYLFIGSSLLSLPLFYCGYLVGKSNILNSEIRKSTTLIGGGIMLASGCLIAVIADFDYINFSDAIMPGSHLLHHLVAIISVGGLLLICKQIKWLPVSTYMGRYSIIILVTNVIAISISQFIIRHIAPDLSLTVKPFAMLLTSIVICIGCIPLLILYFPKLTAQADFIPKRKSLFLGKNIS